MRARQVAASVPDPSSASLMSNERRNVWYTDSGVSTPTKRSPSTTDTHPTSVSNIVASASCRFPLERHPRLDALQRASATGPSPSARASSTYAVQHAVSSTTATQPRVALRDRLARVGERRVGRDRRRVLEALGIDRRDPQPLQRAVGADEVGDHGGRRVPEDLGRRVVLLEDAADVEDRDAVAHLHRFLDVVGDEHDGLAAPRPGGGGTRPAAATRVTGSMAPNGSSISSTGGIGGERPRHADALALPARELRGIAVAVVGGIEPDEVEQLVDTRA